MGSDIQPVRTHRGLGARPGCGPGLMTGLGLLTGLGVKYGTHLYVAPTPGRIPSLSLTPCGYTLTEGPDAVHQLWSSTTLRSHRAYPMVNQASPRDTANQTSQQPCTVCLGRKLARFAPTGHM